MNQRILEELARQRHAELPGQTARYAYRRPAEPPREKRARRDRQSLRVRAGWRLVDLGLKLAVYSDPRAAANPRPARS
jgi:hypothetical protein